MTYRFRDEGKTLHDFSADVYVHCPQCWGFAYMKSVPDDGISQPFGSRALVCKECKYLEIGWNGYGELWLQANCCGHILWAYNLAHLEYIEQYVRATERLAYINDKGIMNTSMLVRLPKWLNAGKNRDEIIKCILKMKNTIPACI